MSDFGPLRTSSVGDGFLGIQQATSNRMSRSATIPITCPNGPLGSAMLYPARFVEPDQRAGMVPTEKRAWIYQEFLLSPRVMSFYDDGFEFKCTSRVHCDDALRLEEERLFPPTAGTWLSILPPIFYRPDAQNSIIPDELDALRRLWVGSPTMETA